MKLLPCPFCGGSALGVDHPPHKHYFVPMPDHPGSYTIECAACNIGLIDDTKEKAEAAWNKRVPYVQGEPWSPPAATAISAVREEALKDAWDAVNALIQTGPTASHVQHERRNGLVMASNAIMALRYPPSISHGDPSP